MANCASPSNKCACGTRGSPGGNSSRTRSRCLCASPHLPWRTAVLARGPERVDLAARRRLRHRARRASGWHCGSGVDPPQAAAPSTSSQQLLRIIALQYGRNRPSVGTAQRRQPRRGGLAHRIGGAAPRPPSETPAPPPGCRPARGGRPRTAAGRGGPSAVVESTRAASANQSAASSTFRAESARAPSAVGAIRRACGVRGRACCCPGSGGAPRGTGAVPGRIRPWPRARGRRAPSRESTVSGAGAAASAPGQQRHQLGGVRSGWSASDERVAPGGALRRHRLEPGDHSRSTSPLPARSAARATASSPSAASSARVGIVAGEPQVGVGGLAQIAGVERRGADLGPERRGRAALPASAR